MRFRLLIPLALIITIFSLSACANGNPSSEVSSGQSITSATTTPPPEDSSEVDSNEFVISDYQLVNANKNAKQVYIAATIWLQQQRVKGEDFKKYAGKLIICRGDKVGYDNKGYIDINGDTVNLNITITDILDGNFSGSFAFVISDTADSISYSLWSNERVKEAVHIADMTELEEFCKDRRQIYGCYPMLDTIV